MKLIIIIDVAIPCDKNTSTKVSEKLPKYKDLAIGITRMWQMKTEIIPVVVGALGVIEKGSEKLVREIPGNSKDNIVGNGTYSTGLIHQETDAKAALKCPRFKVWTQPLEKKYGLMNLTLRIIIIIKTIIIIII